MYSATLSVVICLRLPQAGAEHSQLYPCTTPYSGTMSPGLKGGPPPPVPPPLPPSLLIAISFPLSNSP